MKSLRRMARPGPGAALVLAALTLSAQAQSPQWQYAPARPVRLVVANAPGSPADIVARLVAGRLAEGWGQPVLVENRAGASGLIGVETVAKLPPDGLSLLSVTLSQLISTLMYQRHQLATEFAPLTMVGATPFAIAVPAGSPVKNLAEWIAYVKARPGELMYASSGQWSSSHLCIESFNGETGLQMVHVPHPSSPAALNAMVAGQTAAFCPAGPSINSHVQGGKVRVLGITYQKPTGLVPGAVPISDTVRGFELLGWYGLQMHQKTAPEVVARVNADVVRVLRQPDVQERLFGLGVDVVGNTPQEFGTYLRREQARWAKLLKERGAKPPE